MGSTPDPNHKRPEHWLVHLPEQVGEADLLSEEELERAKRLKLEDKRHQFMVTRTILRKLLAERLGTAAKSIAFKISEHGKPELVPETGKSQQHFNLSHSGDWALVALGDTPLGIDLEFLRSDVDCLAIAKRYFHVLEYEALQNESDERRPDLFFRIWVRKEAYLKALGTGFIRDSRATSVVNSALEFVGVIESDESRWVVEELEVEKGYCGAISWQVRMI